MPVRPTDLPGEPENDELNDANKAALDRTILRNINWYKGDIPSDL